MRFASIEFPRRAMCVLLAVAFVATTAIGGESKTPPAKKADPKAAAAAPAAKRPDFSSVPQSRFDIPATPADGRNPFFPNSTVVVKVPPKGPKTPTVDPNIFVLNGITGPPLRSVIINGRTFMVGEEAEVRVPSGAKVLVKCSDIGDDNAVIEVGGVRKELRLRAGI